MKKIILVGLFFCSFAVHANVVPLTRNYTGQIDSYFRRGNDIFSLGGTTTNGYVTEFSLTYPYSGGMAINQTGDEIQMSQNAIQVATLFGNTKSVECWGSGYVEGTIEIQESLSRPNGTTFELQIDYATDHVSSTSTPFYLDRGAALVDENYNILWSANYSTNKETEHHFLQMITGTTYTFYIWQTFGSSNTPVTGAYGYDGHAVALDFSIIPEPVTVVLLGLGGLMLRKRRKV